MKSDDIFVQIRFMDSDGHCYGKIEEAEHDGETFVFIPSDTREIPSEVMIEANRLINLLNSNKVKELS